MKTLKPNRLFKILPGALAVIILTTLLAACESSNDVTPAPVPTAVPTVDAATPKAPHFSEMLKYLPDSGSLRKLTYNNFASIFKMYGISQDSYTKEQPDPLIKIKNGYTPTLLQSAFSNLLASGASNFTAKDDQVKAFGWSRFQVAAEIYNDPGVVASTPGSAQPAPQPVYILQGQFDPKALDTALSTKGYQKETTGSHTLYSTGNDGKYDPKFSLYEFRIGLNNIAVSNDGTTILVSGYKKSLMETLQLAGDKSLEANQAVKALSAVLDQAQMVNIYPIKAYPTIDNLATYDFRNLFDKPEKKEKALKLAKELPKFPAAKLGALAYYEPQRGERYYLLANYYDTAANAGLARPAMERMLKEGFPFNTGAFYGGADYNSYMTLVESRQQENVLFFKLKMSNDTILFAPSELDYPLGYYKD